MFKCDLNIKNMNADTYSKARNWYKWLKLLKVKMLTSDFEKSNFVKLYIQMWFEFQENERILAQEVKIKQKEKMVKNQSLTLTLKGQTTILL